MTFDEWFELKKEKCEVYGNGDDYCVDDEIKHFCRMGYDFANEWHFDEVPDNENDILCQVAEDEFVVGYYHTKNERYYTTAGQEIEVIAWKKITPPKEG